MPMERQKSEAQKWFILSILCACFHWIMCTGVETPTSWTGQNSILCEGPSEYRQK